MGKISPRAVLRPRALFAAVALVISLSLLGALVWGGGTPASAQDDSEPQVPAKPTGLSVDTTEGSLDVSVDWNDVAGADDYWVRWRPKSGDLNDGVEPTSSATDITVADYGEWVVRVQACNNVGCGAPAALQFAVESAPEPTPEPTPTPTPEPLPAAPTGLQVVTTAGSLEVSVDWDDVAGADEYQMRWRLRSGDLNQGVRVQSSSTDVTVADYGDWVVQVRACSGADCGQGATQTVRVAPNAPGRAFGLTAEIDTAGSSVVLSWQAPTDGGAATGYRMLRRVANAGSSFSALVEDTGTGNTTYTDSAVTVDTEYIYRVQAVNFAGAGETSETAEIFFTDKPGRPSNLSAKLDNLASQGSASHSVTLSWDAPSGGAVATGYQILRREATTGSSMSVLVEDTESTDTAYQDTSATGGKGYVYRVKARNSAGAGAESGSAQVAIPDYHISGSVNYSYIQAIDNPTFVDASSAVRYYADERVVGVSINGDSRAYSIPHLKSHEVVNDTVGGTPIAVTYCWLCLTVLVFERTIDGAEHTFGASGTLMDRANSTPDSPCLLMYDRQTESLWSQVLGLGVKGEHNGVQLRTVPSTFTTWGEWKKLYPTTKALVKGNISPSPNTGVSTADPKDDRNAAVAAASVGDKHIAYPFGRLTDNSVRNVEFNGVNLLVFYDAGSKTALVFDREVDDKTLSFRHDSGSGAGAVLADRQTGTKWKAFSGVATEGSLKGKQLKRIRSHPIFWFSWQNYYPDSRVYVAPDAPASPTGLRVATEVGSLDLSATWDAVAGADSYKVRWRTPTAAFEADNLVDTAATNAAITVSDYGRWWVRVRACKGAVCGPGAIQVVDIAAPPAEREPVPVPGQPTGLQVATESGSLDVSADWDDVAGATSYTVHWRYAAPATGLYWRVDVPSSDAVATMPSAGQWMVKVEACNDRGCGEGQFGLFDVEPPAPRVKPTGLQAAATPGSTVVVVNWDAVDGADTYLVRWRKGVRGAQLNDGVSVATSEARIAVDDYGEWVVKVSACNDAGCGPGKSTRFQVESVGSGYPGQLGEVLVELSLRRPAQQSVAGGVPWRSDRSVRSTHTTSIVYVIDDSGSMDGDFPEVRTALTDVRGAAMADTKVALIKFGGSPVTVFELTDHSTNQETGPWTDARINDFGGKLGATAYAQPLRDAKALLDADTTATTKKIIFVTDAQEPRPAAVVQAIDDAGIIVDTIGFGDHYSDNFSVIEAIATDTGGAYRAVQKPSQGTTNTPAVTAPALADILKGTVGDNTATLFLVDYSFSVYEANEGVLHPALAAAATKAGDSAGTGRQVGLAIFMGGTTAFVDVATTPHYQKYQVVNAVGSSVLSMSDGTFYSTGSTDIDYALQQAYSTITASTVTAPNKRVVLITDGISAADVQQNPTLDNFKNNSAVTLDVVAWGNHADRVQLKTWADSASGNFSVAKAGPARPRGVKATAGEATVTLSWNDPSDSAITKYQYAQWIWYDPEDEENTQKWGAWTDIPGTGATTTWHIFTGLENGFNYMLRLRAVRNDVPGVPNNFYPTVFAIPSSKSNISLEATAGNGQIALSWNKHTHTFASFTTKYQYTQREGEGAWADWQHIPGSDGNTTSHTITGLTNGTAYTIAIRPVMNPGSDFYGLVASATATPGD